MHIVAMTRGGDMFNVATVKISSSRNVFSGILRHVLGMRECGKFGDEDRLE